MKGGDRTEHNNAKYIIPAYKTPNDPMIPNEQKKIYYENKPKYEEKENTNQILDIKLFQPPKPKPAQGARPNPAVFYPNYVPNPFDPMSYAYMQNMNYNMRQQHPIYNDYTINIGGVSGSHITTAMLFEDSLPVKNVAGSFISLGERITMYESIRSVLFTSGDGKDMPIENNTYNLLSHLKFMDMNPYNASRFSRNPYKGLPFGFLLYRSCYPIRHDDRNLSAICSPNSTGINVRIYRLTEGSYMINKQNITKASDYDEWRDVAFYNFIKEQIIKKKICPNFTIMYGYNISLNTPINFDELRTIQNSNRRTTQNSMTQNNMPQNRPILVNQGVTMTRNPMTGAIITQNTQNTMSKEEQMTLLNKYNGKTLVCLTEASNYNILGWAKKEYRTGNKNFNVKTMINPGYHTSAVWYSVIFQMLAALYTMQLKGIVINNFRIDRNVFIKDVDIGGNVTNCWKYKIEGIEYYVPNHGYIVLIDTNYRDFDVPCDDINNGELNRKLDGAFLENCSLTIDKCIIKTFEMFRNAVDPNIFDQDFMNDNGVKPPENILKLLTDIKNSADAKTTLNIAYYIRQFMTMFLHNRVGGPLTDVELNNVKRGAIKEFTKGQIVTMTDYDGIEKFVIHVNNKDGIARIITKDNIDPQKSNIMEKTVPMSSLNPYSVVEPIKQNFKMNESNLNEESLLETYNVE